MLLLGAALGDASNSGIDASAPSGRDGLPFFSSISNGSSDASLLPVNCLFTGALVGVLGAAEGPL